MEFQFTIEQDGKMLVISALKGEELIAQVKKEFTTDNQFSILQDVSSLMRQLEQEVAYWLMKRLAHRPA